MPKYTDTSYRQPSHTQKTKNGDNEEVADITVIVVVWIIAGKTKSKGVVKRKKTFKSQVQTLISNLYRKENHLNPINHICTYMKVLYMVLPKV